MTLAGSIVVAAIGLVVALVLVSGNDSSNSDPAYTSALPPGEFLYLDGPRILTYLSEMEGGEAGAVHRIAGLVSSTNTGTETPDFNISAASQYESKAESTVVRTEASELGILLQDLAKDERKGVSYHYVHLSKPDSLTELTEGDIVRFTTHALVGPGYIRPYVVVRDSATLGALFPRELGNPQSAAAAELHREQAKVFAHQIGPDPRITFLISPGQEGKDIPTILMPMRYAALTTERSLLEKDSEKHTGGTVTVFGKVVRKFESSPHSCRPAHDPCPNYTDFATREVWEHPLDHASRYLVRRVSHNCRLDLEEEAKAGHQEADSLSGRECFLEKLRRQTELFAPSAVIAPIAILK
ncbi:MAG TPA: hypothetical protein VJL81_02480 [Solirubrobacterales bacterium]|nr:hypothetical protein [Solirubrobacterales bacterium]